MTDPLRSEVLVPSRTYTWHGLLVAIGCGTLGVAFAVALWPHEHAQVRVAVVPAPAVPVEVPPTASPAEAAAPPARTARTSDVSLVLAAGDASFIKLADIGEDAERMPKHTAPKLVTTDYVQSSIASVADADVPAAYRHWQGTHVVVDGACETTVTGFVVVAQLTGDPGYAELDGAKWTAGNVLENGSVVLAARLAGCHGTYARDAALPPVLVPAVLQDSELASRARAALIASQPARDAQREYMELDERGPWWEDEYARFETHIVKHPTTGVTWVSVHGSTEHACGDPEVNVWGLFRVEADGSLAAVQLRKLGDLWSVDQLVDLDGDGELELIGKPWLGLDTVITRASGEELERAAVPFFGCPC